MKYFGLFLLIVLLSLLPTVSAQTSKPTACGPTVNERLNKYFDLAEELPEQILNNKDTPAVWEPKTQLIKIGDHTIRWINEVTKLSARSRVEIDGDLIAFEGLESTNEADESRRISLDNSGEWRQIKLYKFYQKDFITITMGPETCTGLSCGIATQLIYDTRSKKKTFFGTFRTDEEVRFFRFTGEVEYFYLSKRFDGDPHGEEKASVTYHLYKLSPDGDLETQKDEKGASYFIKHTYFPDIFNTETRTFNPAEKTDILTQHWFEQIN